LRTGRIITRRTVTPLPMPQSIIDVVHKMAEHDKMPDKIKITTRFDTIPRDSLNIAGVDEEREEETDDDDGSEQHHGDYDTVDVEEFVDENNVQEVITRDRK